MLEDRGQGIDAIYLKSQNKTERMAEEHGEHNQEAGPNDQKKSFLLCECVGRGGKNTLELQNEKQEAGQSRKNNPPKGLNLIHCGRQAGVDLLEFAYHRSDHVQSLGGVGIKKPGQPDRQDSQASSGNPI